MVGFATDPWDEDHVYVAYNSSVFVDEYTDPLADQDGLPVERLGRKYQYLPCNW
ncbi:MAG: hypothetical protein IPJ10_15560 [Flavobacteriales bacterium]|nr:hypothetical protein [Flavobacteriales bacterium]